MRGARNGSFTPHLLEAWLLILCTLPRAHSSPRLCLLLVLVVLHLAWPGPLRRHLRASTADPAGAACAALLPALAAPGLLPVSAPFAALALAADARFGALAVAIAAAATETLNASLQSSSSRRVVAIGGPALTSAVLPLLAQALITSAPGSFTFAEASIVANGAFAVLIAATRLPPASETMRHSTKPDAALLVCALLAAIAVAFVVLPAALCADAHPTTSPIKRNRFPALVLILSLTMSAACVYTYSYFYALRKEPIMFVLQYMLATETRIGLVAYWAALLCVTLAAPPLRGKSRTVARKAYHVLAIAIFVPGVAADTTFTAFASACALALMLVLEAVRVSDVDVLGAWKIALVTEALRDDRDAGPVVLTHIYLLIGCAAPLWAACLNDKKHIRMNGVVSVSGLIALGVVDTFASAVGSEYGRIRWPGSRKTLEGSAAGCIAGVTCALIWTTWISGWSENSGTAVAILAATAVATALEACTGQIDNLVLPLFYFGMLRDVFGVA
jgi:dolichol kinase